MVFAVPGEADNPQAKGTNSLIRDGAKLTESFDDIIEEFEFLPGMRPSEADDGEIDDNIPESSANLADLTVDEKKIVDFVTSAREVSIDQIISTTEINTGTALSLIMGLELKRIIEQRSGKRYAIR
jgi:DNA processing protein